MITIAANISLVIVTLLHLYFLVLEMFLWDKPIGRRIFSLSPEKARLTRVLAMNQGLYNGFLAAGLLWALWLGDAGIHHATFFLLCIIIAGIFGAITVSRRILWIQALPALIALGLVLSR